MMVSNRETLRATRRAVLGAGAAAGVAAIAGPRLVTASSSGARRAPGGRAATSDAVSAAIAKLEPMIADTLETTGVPGLAIAIVHDDAVVYTGGFGVRSMDGGEAVDASTVFQIASVSKALSSTIVAGVVSDGTATWDDAIADHLPGFALSDPWVTREVTIRDCFSHRTGMPGTAGDDLEGIGYSRDEIIHRMRDLNLIGEFRQSYSYSNFGLTLGGIAAAAGAGLPWEDLAEQRLYQPLGMTSTSSRHADFLARENRASLHVPLDGAWSAAFTREPDAQAPAGGVSSNVLDLAQWLRLLLGRGTFNGKELIAADAFNEIVTPQIVRGQNPTTGDTGYYGLGWNVDYDDGGRLSWNHAGAFSVGARTVVNLYPDEALGVVVLTNAFPTGVPEGIAGSFYDLVFNGDLTQDWLGIWNGLYDGLIQTFTQAAAAYATPPSAAHAALPATAYSGTYTNDYFGDISITASGDALELGLGPAGKTLPLRHWDRDVFLHDAAPELPGVMAAVTFEIGADGNATRVVLETFDSYGQGTFSRKA